MNSRLRLALLFLVIVATASCWAKRKPRGDAYPPIRVHVENQNFYDATVYLMWQGNQERLGVTGGHGREDFNAEWRGPQVTFEIALLAGRRYRADAISVYPGDELVLVIPVDPNRLHAYKRIP